MRWFEKSFDTATGRGYSDAGRAFRRRIPEFVRDFQGTPEGRDSVFSCSAPMFGCREGVRVEGDYVLTVEDLRAGRRFPDSVGHCCFPLDSQDFGGAVPPYQIPYGSILVKGLKNLLVAGRCFSATRGALSSARIMAACCLTGQAAGISAAVASGRKLPVRSVLPGIIRDKLLDASGGDRVLEGRLAP